MADFSQLAAVVVAVVGLISHSEQAPSPRTAFDWYVFADEATDFCYNDSRPCGPSKWGGYCNHRNKGRQSPIDLSGVSTSSNNWDLFYRLRLSRAYSKADFDSYYIQNDGHAIQLSFPETETFQRLRVSYDFLGLHPYQFAGAHFHWGRASEYGAEHRVNSSAHVMEIHWVHWSLRYGSIEAALEAKDDPEALTVLGIFVTICPDAVSTPFSQILTEVEGVAKYPSQEMTQVMESISLTQFLPGSKHHYSYQGSLTTPGCLEMVKWTVFREPICISTREIDAFRSILSNDGTILDVNHRPVQSIGRRKIKFYKSS